jgi:XTP/dITP diphosphohydrolase
MILVIATRNLHKVQEILPILGKGFDVLTLRDFEGAPPVVEDATTFAGNAAKKSEGLATWLNQASREWMGKLRSAGDGAYVLADDSGLEVDALNGAPGIYSARFAALDTGAPGNSADADNNVKLMRLLANVPAEKRGARFRCALALTNCGLKELPARTQVFEGACEGRIDVRPSGAGGFGYDPLFIPNGFDRSFAELGEDVKNRISHRSKALEKLKTYFSRLSSAA